MKAILTVLSIGIQFFVSPTLLLAQSNASLSIMPVLRNSQTLQLGTAAAVSQGVNWSLSPAIGGISPSGFYTAPSVITAAQIATITATSASNPSVLGTLAIKLQPTVSISLSPAQGTLLANQTQQFSATLSGATDQSVTWSISPPVGNISSTGLYTAPSLLNATQTIAATATSNADPAATASATVTLQPIVSVAITPPSVQLSASQTQQFGASLAGTNNPNVTWSLSPSVGTIANGLYTAPPLISTSQNVTLTATSAADPTKQATATISLVQPVGLSLSPSSASLFAGQSTQFSVAVTGTTNTAVSWSLSPSVGSLTNGLYVAPTSVSTQQTVIVTATSAAGPTVTAQAAITLMPASPITMPIEVGPGGIAKSLSFNLPTVTSSNSLQLVLTIHGLRYQTEASLQINGGPWQPINSATVTLLGLASNYGGIGGGFRTLTMTMPVTTFQAGPNTLSFTFNGTDGRVSEFRVLSIDVQDANGNSLMPAGTFLAEDPNTWQPPSSNPSDIAAGEALYRTVALTVPTSTDTGAPINAHCMDCHTRDGRDLKYFNYSNDSISNRSVFHGLTAQQGYQIASYIRSLTLPNPGRPWNPPYQPGPGLDEAPVANWAAGAGLSAVLPSDAAVLTAMFPSGVQAGLFNANNVLDVRETPIALQLPDWNAWLPLIHPMDSWSDFLTSKFYLQYPAFLASLIPNSAAAYLNNSVTFDEWSGNYLNFITPKFNPPTWTTQYMNQLEGTARWMLVKTWELNQEFGLEGMANVVFTNPKAEARAWKSEVPFLNSPNLLSIPRGAPLYANGLFSTWVYQAFIWYQTQLVLDNSEYQESGASPIDWGYTYGKVADLAQNDPPPTGWQPEAGLFTLWQTKGLQISNNGLAPNQNDGWDWLVADISRSVTPALREVWTGIAPADRTAIEQGLVNMWLSEVTQFTPAQFYGYLGGGISATQVPVHLAPDSSYFVDRVWAMIPRLAYQGVNQTQIAQMIAWAETVWPSGGWAALSTATCSPSYADATVIVCSTDK